MRAPLIVLRDFFFQFDTALSYLWTLALLDKSMSLFLARFFYMKNDKNTWSHPNIYKWNYKYLFFLYDLIFYLIFAILKRLQMIFKKKKRREEFFIEITSYLHKANPYFLYIFIRTGNLNINCYFELSYLSNPSARAGYDTRSIFKQSLTGLNSEFSFS